jgi:Phosphodiester glycosidase
MELRRRRQRRLLPLLGAVVVVVVLAAVLLSGGGGGRSGAPATTGGPGTTTTTAPPPYLPPAVTPKVSPAQAGEGQWVTQDPWSPAPPSVMTTNFRPEPAQPSIVAYAAWMRSSSTQLALYPGYKGPGPTAAGVDRGQEMVPVAARAGLLATFNSGFYEADASGGFYAHGTLFFPMVNGLATVVSYTNGTVDIINWTAGTTPAPDVVMARQNLPMLVDGGTATAATNVPSEWGITLGGVPAVWRTGLGIDAKGNLIYVAAPAQTAASLAQILIQLGSVRAMQLDINPEWPIFVTYGGPGAASPTLFVPNPNQISNRFLYSSTKDFFALYQRVPGMVQQPW